VHVCLTARLAERSSSGPEGHDQSLHSVLRKARARRGEAAPRVGAPGSGMVSILQYIESDDNKELEHCEFVALENPVYAWRHLRSKHNTHIA